MRNVVGRFFAVLAVLLFGLSTASAQQAGSRIALVIGNGAYQTAPLATAANDAGLVAQTLTAAGFDVTGARDLDGEGVRRAFREFLEKASAAGPDAIAFVYLSGYGLQFDGENFFVPVDANLARDSDIPIQAVRLSDFDHALAGVPLQSRVVVVDGAYADPLVPASDHVAPGLALVDPDAGSLIAFNAAPGTVAPAQTGNYGVYGQALAEMMRAGGVPVDEVFDRVRLRVNDTTKGAVVPWDASKLTTSFVFLDKAPDAPATAGAPQSVTAMNTQPLRSLPAPEAYSTAVARDTFPAYQEFLTAYPDSPYTNRVRRLVAVRREALIWRQTVTRNSSAAYWTYLRRYPKGPHLYDCRRRLALISAPPEPPPSFAPIDYDVPPPPPIEDEIVDRPVVTLFEDDDPPPPPPPVYFLPAEEPDFIALPPPPPPEGPTFLPIPIPIPIPIGAGRPLRDPGTIVPLRGVPGQYAQPRPFMADPNGRLVPQARQDRGPPGLVTPGAVPDLRGGLRPGGPGPQNGQGGVPNPPMQGTRPGLLLVPPAAGAGGPGQQQDTARLRQLQDQQRVQQEQSKSQQLQQQNAQQQQQLRQQQLRQQQGQQRLQQDQLKAQQLQQQNIQQHQNVRQQQEQQLRLQQQQGQQRQQEQLKAQQLQQQNARQQQLRQQQDQVKAQQIQQQKLQQDQQRAQQMQQQQERQRAQQDQQRQQQQQQRAQQVQQQRAQQGQQRAQQQRQQQEQQRAQQVQQQRTQQDQQRVQQQRQQQEQQRAQQVQQQRAQQNQQRVQQQRQQQEQQRAQQMQQQRAQQQQQQQRAQQQQHQGRPDCGHPGQPPCR